MWKEKRAEKAEKNKAKKRQEAKDERKGKRKENRKVKIRKKGKTNKYKEDVIKMRIKGMNEKRKGKRKRKE